LKVVVDTDVVAAALLGEENRGREASALLVRARALMAPAHWKAELANVIWKAVGFGATTAEHVGALLDAADAIPIISVDVAELWRGALARAIAARHPVYDTLFVELAVREQTRVASYDRKLQNQFPMFVSAPSVLLHRG
jgi:predicted nucleic acid-binding protein